MKLKLRSDSSLASLTESQLADLYDWILSTNCYADVQARAAQPVHEGGLGLNIQITTLRRFYAAYTNWLRAKEIADGERAPAGSPDDLHTSAATEVAHSIHDLAHGPLNTSDLKLVAKYLQQQRDHALKTEYLKLAQHHANLATDKQTLAREAHEEDKRRWEYNTAAAALTHHMKFNQVLSDPDLDEREKVWKAREICFGPDPNHPTPETLWTIPTQSGPTHPQARNASDPAALTHSDTLRHTNAPSPVAQPAINPGSFEKLSPHSSVLDTAAPGGRTQIHAVQENTLPAGPVPLEELQPSAICHEPSSEFLDENPHSLPLLSEAKSRYIGKRSEIPTRRDDTHLNSRSERPSMGNIIEARLGSERHTTAPAPDADSVPNASAPEAITHCDTLRHTTAPIAAPAASTQIHAPGENPSLLSEAKSRSIGKQSEIPTRREELRPQHSELPECDPDTLFHTVSHSPAQELEPSAISPEPSPEFLDENPHSLPLLSEAKSRSIGKRSEIPTRRDDTHLDSRSERPSMGNIIEARLGSERHTTAAVQPLTAS